MILTEDRKYSMSLNLIECENITGIDRQMREMEFTGGEFLHAIITCGMPVQRLTPAFTNKRKQELLFKMAMMENALDVFGDRLKKSKHIAYLDSSEKSVITYYTGMFFTKLFTRKIFDVEYLTHLSMIREIYGNDFIEFRGKQRADLIGYKVQQDTWSVWEAKGRSEHSKSALEEGYKQAKEVKTINGKTPERAAACMTFYEGGYLMADIKDPQPEGEIAFEFSLDAYLHSYYQHIAELIGEEMQEEERTQMDFLQPRFIQRTIEIPDYTEHRRGQNKVTVGMPYPLYRAVTKGNMQGITEILKESLPILSGEKNIRYVGPDGIYIQF